MVIFYTCDDNFVWLAGISIISICETNRELEQIDFYLLGDNISETNKQKMEDIVRPYERSFTLINVPILDVPDELTSIRWPRSAYIRLFAGLLLPQEVNRALYLDCDIIINGSLKALDGILLDYTMTGVKDCISSTYKENIGLDKNARYINAGVILMNIAKLREMNMKQCITDFFSQYSKKMFFADQDVLNGIFKGKVGILNPKYDVMTILYAYSYRELLCLRKPTNYYDEEDYEKAKSAPVIIHFTTNMTQIRPWIKGSKHPYAFLFDRYQALSPWANKEKEYRKPYTSSQKIMSLILSMPKYIGLPLLGFLHASLRPLLLKYKHK